MRVLRVQSLRASEPTVREVRDEASFAFLGAKRDSR
jgi:hypothetical protein